MTDSVIKQEITEIEQKIEELKQIKKQKSQLIMVTSGKESTNKSPEQLES